MVKGKIKSSIEGFEHYEITEYGHIYALTNLSPEYDTLPGITKRVDRAGYITVRLSEGGNTYTKYLHRLLAQTFIPNPQNKPHVNHKNGCKTDNHLGNLEWVTHQENVKDAYKQGLNSTAKRILDSVTGVVYTSITEAANAIGIIYNTCCKRLKRHLPSFRLRYAG